MSIAHDLTTARTWALETLTDTVTITRRSSTPTVDDLGTEHWTDTVTYAGPGLVQALTQNQAHDMDATGAAIVTAPHVLKLPGGTDVRPGDKVTIAATLTPGHTGPWWVDSVPTQGWGVLMRLPLSSAAPSQR